MGVQTFYILPVVERKQELVVPESMATIFFGALIATHKRGYGR